jgi:tRNA nucleotidyltransferase (CCA-adding enzyme)
MLPQPIPSPVISVVQRLQEAGYATYLVGGCVRDMLLGRSPKDYDVATAATPEQVQACFNKVIPTGIQHGTVTVIQEDHHVEVTTFRVDGVYTDGRRPEGVVFMTDIKEDLARRDFTINAIAFDPLGSVLIDPFGGQEDLRAGIIRAVGNPLERFAEDGLRCLRAVRFAAVLGFSIDPPTWEAIQRCLEIFKKVAQERVREELIKLLMADYAPVGLIDLANSGLLEVIIPELWKSSVKYISEDLGRAPKSLLVRVSLVIHHLNISDAETVLRRLTFPIKEIVPILRIVKLDVPSFDENDDHSVRCWLSSLGENLAMDAISYKSAYTGLNLDRFRDRVGKILAARPALHIKDLALDGNDVVSILKVKPGKIVGEATRHLMDVVLKFPEMNSKPSLKDELVAWYSWMYAKNLT